MSDLKTYLRSGFAALYAVTYEEDRAMKEICTIAEQIKFNVWQWTASTGVINPQGGVIEKLKIGEQEKPTTDPAIALRLFLSVSSSQGGKKLEGVHIPNKSVFILKDFHLILKKQEPGMIRMIKDAIAQGRRTARSIMVMGCQLHLPPELEKEFTTVEFPLPGREMLQEIAEKLAMSKGIELNGKVDAILDAATGLTSIEFADAAAASLTQHNDIVPTVIADIKAHTIKKGGVLELIKPGVTFENLGGMHAVKGWVTKRKGAFTKAAREYGLPMPKGILLLGVPGSGKSFLTRAIADELEAPHLALDVSRLFSGTVGSSEQNVRNVILQVEAFGKCVLRIDEIEKAFAGASGYSGDSGVTKRMFGSFLTWMAEKTSPVFIVATANDVSSLPPELLRKGRWDEMFFIDLPTLGERVEIWRAQLLMKKRDPKAFDLMKLADATDSWTGAEIEALVNEGLFAEFAKSNGKSQPSTELLIELSKLTAPLSRTMAENISAIRAWSKGRCRLASEEVK